MEIKIAREIGYCYGVRDAVELAVDASKEKKGDAVYALGPIIHNKQTIEQLEKEHHVLTVDSKEQIPDGSTVVIRAHGATPEKMQELRTEGYQLLDGTCPFVQKTQKKAKQFVEEGYFVVILGKKAHPEVVGIAGFAGDQYVVVEHEEDLAQVPRCVKMAVVFQSTVTLDDFAWALPALAEKAYEIRLLKTICGVTITRQKRTDEVAREVEVMLIIGGKNSSNTKKLVDVARQFTPRTYHLEDANELDKIDFAGVKSVGISTGTSTPDFLVDEVVTRLHQIAAAQSAVA